MRLEPRFETIEFAGKLYFVRHAAAASDAMVVSTTRPLVRADGSFSTEHEFEQSCDGPYTRSGLSVVAPLDARSRLEPPRWPVEPTATRK